jgi:hypothetical protein
LSHNYLKLVSLLTKRLEDFEELTPLTLANCFYSLRRYAADSPAHEQLTRSLTRLLNKDPSISISNAHAHAILVGSCSFTDSPSHRALLLRLVPILREGLAVPTVRPTSARLTSDQVSEIVQAVCAISFSESDTRDFLELATQLFHELTNRLTNGELSRCLLALQNSHRS